MPYHKSTSESANPFYCSVSPALGNVPEYLKTIWQYVIMFPSSSRLISPRRVLPSVSDEAHDNSRTTSTKVKSLITDLLNRNHGDKRRVTVLIAQCLTTLTGPKCCILYWTKTLDMIEIELRAWSVPHSRFDGQLSSSKWAQALQDFSENAEIPVFLVLLSCGGLGWARTQSNV